MTPKNRKALDHRVRMAGQAALSKQKYVTSIDVLVGMGWLDPAAVPRWRKGQVDYLERVVQANLSRISEAMRMFRAWAAERGLTPSETHYHAHNRGRATLRFSKSGHPSIENQYRTHWVSRELSERKRERMAEQASRAARQDETLMALADDIPWAPERLEPPTAARAEKSHEPTNPVKARDGGISPDDIPF